MEISRFTFSFFFLLALYFFPSIILFFFFQIFFLLFWGGFSSFFFFSFFFHCNIFVWFSVKGSIQTLLSRHKTKNLLFSK